MEERNEFTCEKARLRKILLERRKNVKDREDRARAATERILPLLKGNVSVYASFGAELDTRRLIDILLSSSGINLFAPYTKNGVITHKKIVAAGQADSRGNLPDECYYFENGGEKIDICVTPLLGFDLNGYRIGYGQGCYDRYFSAHKQVFRIGLAFDCQQTEFEHEITDVPLNCCVTETKVIYF